MELLSTTFLSRVGDRTSAIPNGRSPSVAPPHLVLGALPTVKSPPSRGNGRPQSILCNTVVAA